MWKGFLRCSDCRFILFALCGLFSIPIFFFLFHNPLVVEGASGPLILLYPSNNAMVNREDVEVIGYVTEPNVKEVTVSFKKGRREEKVAVERGVFYKLAKLDKGLNEIRVETATKSSVSASIFYKPSGSKEEAPGGFKSYYLHAPSEGFNKCIDCHQSGEPDGYKKMKMGQESCQTAKCHAEFGKKEYVHGPVGGRTCIACHNPHGSFLRFEVSRAGGELCYVCHENKRVEFTKEVAHPPVEGGDCIACHDSHESAYKYQLKAGAAKLCFTCHENNKTNQNFVHGPVATGDCNVCHMPHGAPNKYLLVFPGTELCYSCHEDKKAAFDKKKVHKPLTEGCSKCHNSHGSPYKAQLIMGSPQLCFNCHKDFPAMVNQKVSHKPVAEGQCPQCHNPHASDNVALLMKAGVELCFTCHTKLGEKVIASKSKHGPVQQGDCSACHRPHGSDNPKILVKYFPAEFYNSFTLDNYALCFDCHNKTIALDKSTTTLTSFRNKSLNLHFLHVNKQDRGRSCKACHEVHASDQAKHIRLEVPYGKWSYPITFTKADNGGKCVVGCHKPQAYTNGDK